MATGQNLGGFVAIKFLIFHVTFFHYQYVHLILVIGDHMFNSNFIVSFEACPAILLQLIFSWHKLCTNYKMAVHKRTLFADLVGYEG